MPRGSFKVLKSWMCSSSYAHGQGFKSDEIRASIWNHMSGGQCHLIHLIILRRLSRPRSACNLNFHFTVVNQNAWIICDSMVHNNIKLCYHTQSYVLLHIIKIHYHTQDYVLLQDIKICYPATTAKIVFHCIISRYVTTPIKSSILCFIA